MPTKTIYKTLPSSSSLSYVTQGTYQRELVELEAQAWTEGTEFEVAAISNNIVAATENRDDLFSWVKFQGYLFIWATVGQFEWMVLRMESGDGLPNLNDNGVVEALQKDKRILKRGFYMTANAGYEVPPKIKFELFNVKLRYGEEIRLVIRPMETTADAGQVKGILEWRQVGV